MEIRVLAGVLFLAVLIICRMFTYVMPSVIMLACEIAAYVICGFVVLYSKFTRVKTRKIIPKIEKIVIKDEEKEQKQAAKSSSPRKIEKQEIKQQDLVQYELKKIKVFPEYDPVWLPSLINNSNFELEHKDISKYSEKFRGLKSELTNQFESIDCVTKAEYNGLSEYLKNTRRYDNSIEEKFSVQNKIVENYNAIIEEITRELSKRIEEEEAENLRIEEEKIAKIEKIDEEKIKVEEEKLKIAKEAQESKPSNEKMQKGQQEEISVKSLLVSDFLVPESKPLDNSKQASKASTTEVQPEAKPENIKQSNAPLIPPKPNQPETIKPASKEPQISQKSSSNYSQDREVPFIAPGSSNYKNQMEKLIAEYNASRLEADKNVSSSIRDDINATVNQITSSRTDIEHLNRRIEIAINVLKGLNERDREDALYLLCERVTSAVQDKCDSITYGPEYTLNFIDFILTIGKTYPEIRKKFFLSILNRRKILVPIYGTADPERIMNRVLLNDLDEKFNNDMCITEMSLSRSYGILLASFYTHKDSPCNVGDCWRWLSYFLNIPEEYIDRNYIPTLEGFLKVSSPFMKQHYSSQYVKIISLLNDAYLPMIKQRFLVRYQYRTFIAQLQKVISEL